MILSFCVTDVQASYCDMLSAFGISCFFFFFKQKTAYEIQYGLVGSEMCIRDSFISAANGQFQYHSAGVTIAPTGENIEMAKTQTYICLLYTSDAADERSSVDLGGRRIIKKKKRENIGGTWQTTQNKNNKNNVDKLNKER